MANRFVVEFKTSGSAFCDPETGEESKDYETAAAADVITDVLVGLNCERRSGVLMDYNGNKIGQWSFESD